MNFFNDNIELRSKTSYSMSNSQSVHRELSHVINESSKSNEARENESDRAVISFSFIFN